MKDPAIEINNFLKQATDILNGVLTKQDIEDVDFLINECNILYMSLEKEEKFHYKDKINKIKLEKEKRIKELLSGCKKEETKNEGLKSLKESRIILKETEELGNNIMVELKIQRDKIQKTDNNIKIVKEEEDRSDRNLNKIKRNEYCILC
jgi:hypothetical protein